MAGAAGWVTGLLACGLGLPLSAADVRLRMLDAQGLPLADGVLAATPLDQPALATPAATATMAQRGQRFDPHLLVIRRGDSVDFPNLDQTRHHVYSFSAARRFELKLYLGPPAAPVRFPEAGIVTLGCNIHDWMLGYVVVVDTPHHTRSGADGMLALDLPEGRWRLWAWHPRMAEDQHALDEEIVLQAGGYARELRPALGPVPLLDPPVALGLPPAGAP